VDGKIVAMTEKSVLESLKCEGFLFFIYFIGRVLFIMSLFRVVSQSIKIST